MQGVDPEHVLVMTGASEALDRAHLPVRGRRRLHRVAEARVSGGAGAGARLGSRRARIRTATPRRVSRRPRDHVLSAVDANDPRRVREHTAQPHGLGHGRPANSASSPRRWPRAAFPLIVDEVYHPLYFTGDVPGASALPNTIVLGDFAKALSIPGLRIGWLIDRDAERREALLDLRSYFTISSSPLTEAIGAHALAHAPAILQRLQDVARANLALLAPFMDEHRELLGWAPPAGGTTCFPWLARWPRRTRDV